MGNYNPHAPYIIGQEWVPIRQANYIPDTTSERGYTFRLDHTVTPVSGTYYNFAIPDHIVSQSMDFISVYPAGAEDRTGPIKKLRIPASAVALSPNPPYVIDLSEGYQALNNPTDTLSINFQPNTVGESDELLVSFDVASVAQQLLGKRILDVRVLYSVSSFTGYSEVVSDGMFFGIEQSNLLPFGDSIALPQDTQVTESSAEVIVSVSITDLNPFWNAAVGPSLQRDVFPWRLQELMRFNAGYTPSTDQLFVDVDWQVDDPNGTAFMGFLNLEVVYCEETRVLYGGRRTTNVHQSGALTDWYEIGPQVVRLRSPSLTPGAVLTPGDYSVVISHRDLSRNSIYSGAPTIYAARQYYELPPLRGVHVQQSLTEGETFTTSSDDVITHLTLHTASSIVTGVHAYGTSAAAPIHTTRTATQEIEDNPANGAQYPQVRFYARRFGDTTVPLTLVDVATGTSTVSISVAEFDALDEITDGWREVTLRFATPPTFTPTGGDIDWRWQATGEQVGNQWQILAASGPSVASPTPFFAALATGPATYWAPLGSSVALTWQSPTISGAAEDSTTDAVLLFSQDPPAVTGFAITQESQELTGIAADACDLPLGCVPTAIDYNRLTWTGFGACDTFDERTSVATWNTTSSGQTWTESGGAASDYSVADGVGSHLTTTIAQIYHSLISVGSPDMEVQASLAFPVAAPGGASLTRWVAARLTDTSNYYVATLDLATTGVLSFNISKRVAGSLTQISSTTLTLTSSYAANTFYTVKLSVIGSMIRASAWNSLSTKPLDWMLTVTDTALTTGTQAGLLTRRNTSNTNGALTLVWDDFSAVYASLVDGSIEVQRRDSVTTDWQTIMLATSPGCVSSFADYEARVGTESEYRIRTVNALDFVGSWVTGAGTIPDPGVTITGDANSLLVFTSNWAPERSLAYTMQWEGAPVETFAFPEADTLQLQRMFGKNFFTAFHPLERGGERFERVILVNAAATALPSLANITDLREFAWEDLDYICVRDELGNRWFANVALPSLDVRDNRQVYLAKIIVTEVSDTASPVDPAEE